MIFAAVLSPTIKIFHRHLGPNLYIFVVKVSPWFHRHFMEILWHITAISLRKITDQGDFVLKISVRTVPTTWYSLCKNKHPNYTKKNKLVLSILNVTRWYQNYAAWLQFVVMRLTDAFSAWDQDIPKMLSRKLYLQMIYIA